MKNQKGITLAVLMITVIVLIILASISIPFITKSELIDQTKNAAQTQEYRTSQTNKKIQELNDEDVIEHKVAYSDDLLDTNGVLTKTAGYTDTNGKTATIPKGFKVSEITEEQTINKGLVIKDAVGNEFVWIPVDHINEMIMCQTHPTATLNETTLQCPTCRANTKLAGKLYATSTGTPENVTTPNESYSATSGLREPANLTHTTNGDNTTNFSSWTSTLYQTCFDAMAESVAKYHGFYIGRYEMSKSSNGVAQSKTGETSVSAADNSDNYANGVNQWFGLYTLAKTYTNESITSEMIWGSQYDAMMRWMNTNGTNVTQITPTDSIVGTTVKNTDSKRRTGLQPKDRLNNVFDLLGNRREWTQEASSTSRRVTRGGYYSSNNAPSNRAFDYATYTSEGNGSRMSFYINL